MEHEGTHAQVHSPSLDLDPTDFTYISTLPLPTVVRLLHATRKATFLRRIWDRVFEWKSDDVRAAVIANLLEQKTPEAGFERLAWMYDHRHRDPGAGSSSGWEDVEGFAEINDKLAARERDAEQALEIVDEWRRLTGDAAQEFDVVKDGWIRLWDLVVDQGRSESDGDVRTCWMGILGRVGDIQSKADRAREYWVALQRFLDVSPLRKVTDRWFDGCEDGLREVTGMQGARFIWISYRGV